MPLSISNNSAVASASYYLDKNQKALQHSIKKLASGKRIIAPNDDPGTLSVVMKLNASVKESDGKKIAVLKGKVWERGTEEPKEWTITWEDDPGNVIGVSLPAVRRLARSLGHSWPSLVASSR